MLAAQALVADGVDAVFTPTDNTVMKAELAIYETFADAGIPQYTGADSFALNGAFLGYGVDYANLGRETADMIADILLNGAEPAPTPPVTHLRQRHRHHQHRDLRGAGLDFDAICRGLRAVLHRGHDASTTAGELLLTKSGTDHPPRAGPGSGRPSKHSGRG